MDDLSIGPAVSFEEETKDNSIVDRGNHHNNKGAMMIASDDFNDVLPQLNGDNEEEEDDDEDDMDHHILMDDTATSGMDHFLDPDTNFITLEWETSLLPDAFLNHSHSHSTDFDVNSNGGGAGRGFFLDTTLGLTRADPTEVSDEEMTDFDTSHNNNHNHQHNSDNDSSSLSQSMEHRWQDIAKRLAVSMEKSRQSRVSLTLETPAVAQLYNYDRCRTTSLSSIVSSVEESSQQLLATLPPGSSGGDDGPPTKAAGEGACGGRRSPSLSSTSDYSS